MILKGIYAFCLSALALLCPGMAVAQELEGTLRLTPPANQSEEMDVLVDPWSGLETVTGNGEQVSFAADGEGQAFCIDLDLRGRGEYRNGWGTLRWKRQKPAWFVSDRARLSMGYSRGILSARVSGQHAGIWGDETLEGKKGAWGLHEAWGRVDAPMGLFVQVGRQVLSYDDERILGAEDWNQYGFTHDVVRLGYEHGMHKVHGIVGFNQAGEKTIGGTYYDGAKPYKNMQFLWYHYGNGDQPLQFSLMGLNQGLEIGSEMLPKTGYMQMVGGWFQYRRQGWYGKAEGYYELGHDQDQRAMSAFLAGVRGGYDENRWGAVVGADYVSGSKSSLRKGTNKCFDLLYGSAHCFYGSMDYFMRGTMLSCGLIDATASVHGSPVSGLDLSVDYHYFMTGVKRARLHRQLGHELDLRLRYNLLKDVAVEAGYSVMMPTSVLVYFKDGSSQSWQDWGWVSVCFSPRLFSAKSR